MMKKFLLVLFGKFETTQDCKDIALNITPLVDSPHLKFNHTSGVLVFHFASEVHQDEIYAYIQGSLVDVVSSFILTEMSDKVSLCFPQEVKTHLLDLENDGGDVQIKIDLNKNQLSFDEEEEDNFVALLLDEVKRQVKPPTLDQILDKINNKGFESLTQFEKDILDEYSK
jgi:hypothetical protein